MLAFLLSSIFIFEIDSASIKAQVYDRPKPIKQLTTAGDLIVNGTFFCTRTGKPVGTIKSEGKILSAGSRAFRWAFFIIDGRPTIKPLTQQTLNQATFAVAGYPLIVDRKLLYRQTTLSLTQKARRTAIAITGKGQVLIIVVSHAVTLKELAQIVLNHGAVSALNLDGGFSVNLMVKSKILVLGRPLSNAIIANESKKWANQKSVKRL